MLPDDEQIRRRAYEIWEREGRPEGRESEHWRMAVEELRARSAPQEVPAQRVRGPAQLDETSPAPSGNAGSLSQPGPGDAANVPAAPSPDPESDPLQLAKSSDRPPRKRGPSRKRARPDSSAPPDANTKVSDRTR